MKTAIRIVTPALVLVAGPIARAAEFNIANGDVAGLVNAILLANINDADDTIHLAPNGDYRVRVQYVTGGTAGSTGLPPILSDNGHALTIVGNGAVIRRQVRLGGARFRLFSVAAGADVGMFSLTVANGDALDGGAIRVAGELSFVGSQAQHNRADRDGGALFVTPGGVLRLHHNTIRDNFAAVRGGAVFNQGTCHVHGTTINDNRAGQSGGGVHNQSATFVSPLPGSPVARLTLANSTVSGNMAPHGAGLRNVSEAVFTYISAVNCTIAANIGTNPSSGAGMDNQAQMPGAVVLTVWNTVIGGNTGGAQTTPVIGHGVYIGANPLLGPLADNGGTTLTHMPLPGSPLINQGVNHLALDPGDDGAPGGDDDWHLVTDQRGSGHSRILGGVVDIGAVERPLRVSF